MQVPKDLMSDSHAETINRQIFITRFKQNAPSKIYTEVKENLLVIVLTGRKKLVYKNYETTVHEGEFALFHKGNYIMNQIVNQKEYESLLIFVSDAFIKNMKRNRTERLQQEKQPYYQGNITAYMQEEVILLMHLFEKEDATYDDIIRLKVQELFTYMLAEDKTGHFESFLHTFDDGEDEDFRSFLIHHIDQYDNILSMAEAMNMSISTFKRKFYHTFHATPHKWLNEQKLEKTLLLLNSSDYSVTDICFICGFESMSTFISLFKKRYGASPGKYRKKFLMQQKLS